MSKPWDDEYLKDAFADEITLAKIHPKWRRTFKAPAALSLDAPLQPGARATNHFGSANSSRLTFSTVTPQVPPQWRRSWNAAGPLATELGLSIRHDHDEGAVSVSAGGGRRNVTEVYVDHPSADAAALAAIVRAAIQRLTELREAH